MPNPRTKQKAKEIVKKTLRSNLEKTMLEDLKRVISKFFKLTNRLIRTREKYQSLVQQVLESNHFRFQNQKSLTTKLEREWNVGA